MVASAVFSSLLFHWGICHRCLYTADNTENYQLMLCCSEGFDVSVEAKLIFIEPGCRWVTPVVRKSVRYCQLKQVVECYRALGSDAVETLQSPDLAAIVMMETNHRLTAFVPGQPGYTGTRRNTLPSAVA